MKHRKHWLRSPTNRQRLLFYGNESRPAGCKWGNSDGHMPGFGGGGVRRTMQIMCTQSLWPLERSVCSEFRLKRAFSCYGQKLLHTKMWRANRRNFVTNAKKSTLHPRFKTKNRFQASLNWVLLLYNSNYKIYTRLVRFYTFFQKNIFKFNLKF